MFQGFPEETVRFFLDLRFHNEVPWFHAHRQEYETYIRKPFFDFIEALSPALSQISDDMELRPGKCLARINRDIRYTRDKSPYRDHLWALFRRSGEARETSVVYWFELSPETVEWGLGFWGPNRPAMDVLREHMVQKPAVIRQVLRSSGLPDENLPVYGDRYVKLKPPAGMAADLAMLYPCKEIYIKRINVPLQVAYTPELLDAVSRDLLRLKPMYRLLRNAADVGMSRLDQ